MTIRQLITLGFLTMALGCGSFVQGADNVSAIIELKPGSGKPLVQVNCIPCHSTAIIASNHLNRDQWDEIITTMQKKNGMWPIAGEIRRQILDYLVATQRPEDVGLKQGKTSPWAAPIYQPNPLWK